MGKGVVTSAKYSSLEVVDSAKFDNEIVYEDLALNGTSLTITVSEDITMTSTATSAPWGISELSVGPLTNVSTGTATVAGSITFSAGDNDVNTDGSVVLGHDSGGVIVNNLTAGYDQATDAHTFGVYGATAVVQPTTAIADVAFAANTSGITDGTATYGGYTVGQVVNALQTLGLLA